MSQPNHEVYALARAILLAWCGNSTDPSDRRPRVGKRAAAATPPEFRDLLLSIARSTAANQGAA